MSADRRHSQGLPRHKILRGRRNFERLFSQSSILKTSGIQLRYRIYDDPSEGCYFGFIAKKKLGKAAKRNRIKRLLREAYRTHQYLVADLFASNAFGFHGAFMARQADLTYPKVQADIVSLLKKLRPILTDHIHTGSPVNTRKKKE